MATNFRNRPASQHSFAMVPRADIPRSKYLLQQARKQAFDAAYLVPMYCEEMVPGDHFQGSSTIFARFATPITPVLDNAELETFYFFVPNRIVWEHWEEFIAGGNYTVPQVQNYNSSATVGSIWDHFGLPVAGQISANIDVSALPFRAYNKIYNEWFRDQNLTTALTEETDDGPDLHSNYTLVKRAKKHDYFTSCLPWPQKGTAVALPFTGNAPVIPTTTGANPGRPFLTSSTAPGDRALMIANGGVNAQWSGAAHTGTDPMDWSISGLEADMSAVTLTTINAIRLAFQTQRLLERDARGGTRYTELIQSHFGVRPPDYRLQRPEYIGGGRLTVNTHPIPQTSGTGATGEETPQGNLAAFTTASGGGHRFSYACTEHGYIIGLVNVRADLTYQQGTRKHWNRTTRYDFYFPAFAHLGEQVVTNKEIYTTATSTDADPFGYQERWAEYRYTPNEITGLFRSTAATTIDIWHYSEEFGSLPALNNTFITDPSTTTIARSLAVGAAADGQQILMDVLHQVRATRPMPTYSVPGLIDHF